MRETCTQGPDGKGVRFLYRTRFGSLLLRLIAVRWVARLVGFFLDRGISKPLIKKFIRKHGIRMEDFLPQKYRSFNDFFTRKIRPELRPFDFTPEAFCSPCDGRVTVFPVTEDGVFRVKGFDYTVGTLLRDEALAKKYEGGTCVVLRLVATDYHRYFFSDDGTAEQSRYIKGKLHTVQPTALAKRRVFTENCREYTLLHTERFGDIVQVEVGAMFVGRIANEGKETFSRGEEKGRFEFGGSTVILLLEKDKVELDGEFFENTAAGLETKVLCGERIGKSGHNILWDARP